MTGGGIRPGGRNDGIENVVPGNIGRGTVFPTEEETIIVFEFIIVGGNMCPNPGLLKGTGAITGKPNRLDSGVIGISRGIDSETT